MSMLTKVFQNVVKETASVESRVVEAPKAKFDQHQLQALRNNRAALECINQVISQETVHEPLNYKGAKVLKIDLKNRQNQLTQLLGHPVNFAGMESLGASIYVSEDTLKQLTSSIESVIDEISSLASGVED